MVRYFYVHERVNVRDRNRNSSIMGRKRWVTSSDEVEVERNKQVERNKAAKTAKKSKENRKTVDTLLVINLCLGACECYTFDSVKHLEWMGFLYFEMVFHVLVPLCWKRLLLNLLVLVRSFRKALAYTTSLFSDLVGFGPEFTPVEQHVLWSVGVRTKKFDLRTAHRRTTGNGHQPRPQP